MRNPRTLKELLADPRVADGWWEDDGYGDTDKECDSPSLWVSMKAGWYDHRERNSIHAKTVKEACERIKGFSFDPSRS